jgi:hypothetical protein
VGVCMVDREIQVAEVWHTVSGIEFRRFLSAYPRPLHAEPPIERKARYREYRDTTLPPWPEDVIAKSHEWRRSVTYLVRGEFVAYCEASKEP